MFIVKMRMNEGNGLIFLCPWRSKLYEKRFSTPEKIAGIGTDLWIVVNAAT